MNLAALIKPNDQLRLTYIRLLKSLGIIAASFAVLVALLLIINYFQTQSLDPMHSPALSRLLQKLEENPDDKALKEEIRAVDLLSRKAFFTTQWQLKTGGLIIIICAFIAVGSFKLRQSLMKQVTNPKELMDAEPPWLLAGKTRSAILISGAGLLLASLILGFLSHRDISDASVFASVPDLPSEKEQRKNWMNFRGPGGNGIARYHNVPLTWNSETGENILWKSPVPKQGYSSPIAWKDKLFLSGGDRDQREVYCYRLKDGERLWTTPLQDLPEGVAKAPSINDGTGFAAPTMATNGVFVYAVFATGYLVALDMNGKIIWDYHFGIPDNHYGHSSSLITYGELLLVQWDQNANSRLVAFNYGNGTIAWEHERTKISWASPIVVDAGKRMELILVNSTTVSSYDPVSGELLWEEADCLNAEVAPSPAFWNGWIFVGNEYAVGLGLDLSKEGDTKIAWEWDDALPSTSSPVAMDNFLYFVTSDGLITCLDATKGETLYEQEFDDGFYASPLVVGKNVLLVDLEGNSTFFKLGSAYQAVGTGKLDEDVSATPAILDGKIIIRGDKNLYCIGKN